MTILTITTSSIGPRKATNRTIKLLMKQLQNELLTGIKFYHPSLVMIT